MPQTAEQVARRWNLTRTELDEFALASHQRAVKAIASGRFADEIVRPAVRRRSTRRRGTATRHQPRAACRAPPGQRSRRARHRRQLQLAQRRGRGDGDRQRGVRRAARAPASGTRRGGRVRRRAPPRSWASARSRPPARHWPAPAGPSTTSMPSSSTRPSPPSRSPASATSASTPRRVNADGGAIALGHPLGARARGSSHPPRAAGADRCTARPGHHVRRRRTGHRAARGATVRVLEVHENRKLSPRGGLRTVDGRSLLSGDAAQPRCSVPSTVAVAGGAVLAGSRADAASPPTPITARTAIASP